MSRLTKYNMVSKTMKPSKAVHRFDQPAAIHGGGVIMKLSMLVIWIAQATSFAPHALQRPQLQSKSKSTSNTSRWISTAAAVPTVELDEGLVKTISEKGNGNPLRLGDIVTLKYSCYLVTPEYENPSPAFAKSTRQKFVVGDGSMIPAWEKALRTMRVGERSIVRVSNSALAYGQTGVPPLIPPNAVIEMDLQVLDAIASTSILYKDNDMMQPTADLDRLAAAVSARTPQTASDIAAAYEARQAARAASGIEELEGLELWIEKAKNFYFFGLFESETGERPPWFLRPSITFPLAFAIVGLAFYISFVSGAITERGSQIKDELDEIILSLTDTSPDQGITTGSAGLIVAIASAILPAVIGAPTSF